MWLHVPPYGDQHIRTPVGCYLQIVKHKKNKENDVEVEEFSFLLKNLHIHFSRLKVTIIGSPTIQVFNKGLGREKQILLQT